MHWTALYVTTVGGWLATLMSTDSSTIQDIAALVAIAGGMAHFASWLRKRWRRRHHSTSLEVSDERHANTYGADIMSATGQFKQGYLPQGTSSSGGSSTSAYGAYTYFVTIVAGVITAYNNKGTAQATTSTTDLTVVLNALAAANITILLDSLTFPLLTTFTSNFSNITIFSLGGCIIQGPTPTGVTHIVAGDGTHTVDRWNVAGIIFDGNGVITSNIGAVHLRNATRSNVQNCLAQNFLNTSNTMLFAIGGIPGGARNAEVATDCAIDTCYVADCYEAFVIGAFSAPAGTWARNRISGCKATSANSTRLNWGVVIQFGARGCVAEGNQVSDAGIAGILIRNATSTTVVGNTVDDYNGRSSKGIQIDQNSISTEVVGNDIHNLQNDGLISGQSNGLLIDGNIFKDNGLAANATYYDVELAGGGAAQVTNTLVTNNIFRASQANKVAYHVGETGASGNQTNSVVKNNQMDAGATGQILFAGTTNGGIAEGNPGYNPLGVSAITVTASPFTYTAGNTPESVYVSGGTISAVAKNAISLFTAAGSIHIYLQPHEAITVTYTVAPTMNKDQH